MEFSVTDIALPVKGTAAHSYPGTLTAAGAGLVIASWLEGTQADRFGVLDTATGTWRRGMGVRGLVSDARVIEERDVLLLLCSFGLVELDLSSMRPVRTLRKGLGPYKRSMETIAPGVVGISNRYGRAVTLVSTESLTILGTLRTAAPNVVVDRGGDTLLLSFESGTARAVSDGALAGKRMTIPVSPSAVVVGGRVAYVPSGVESRRPGEDHLQAPIVQRASGPIDPFESRLYPEGRVAWLDPASLRVLSVGPDLGVRRVITRTDDGLLIATTDADWTAPTSVLILDRDAERVLYRYPLSHGIASSAHVAGTTYLDSGNARDRPYITALTGNAPTPTPH
ncbi:hypothetical protein CLV49_0813 [Labedella gwakjiensis]|uniref:Uncharacterized protein n=1 Tax=Labedella gwakjiensis TaxID=390269 RepID=A0A2P8GTA4_9MICO|nr:hypothetical protein [Labedella gwakjiensis]PSL37206.1 hypothetical protein CLV49_0813 [Labedella gwakjiensis]RUQ84542.1 hypothetical protein ELQ93_13085 [Labedella gwakjiensis]